MKGIFASSVCFAGLLFSFAARANDVVLLTSVDFSDSGGWFRKEYYRTYHLRLEEAFREHFEKSGYRLKVYHYAHQDDLWGVLRSPETVAVFWVSHAGGQVLGLDGVTDVRAILDEYGYDVAPVFQAAGPKLQYLAVIGCNSNQAMELLRKSGSLEKNANLVIESFDHKVDAMDGLSEALDKSAAALSRPVADKACVKSKGIPISVTRTIPTADDQRRHPPVRIEWRGTVLSVFPVGFPGETQRREMIVPYPDAGLDPSELKFVISAGANAAISDQEIALGDFQFSGAWSGASWKPFENAGGAVLGVTNHVYRYDGAPKMSNISIGPIVDSPLGCAE